MLVGCAAMAVACGGSPTRPTGVYATHEARLTRTQFMAFGDSLTTGEVTVPIGRTGGIGALVVVPSASYPTILQARLQASYPSQANKISVRNEGRGAENILDGVNRFDEVFDADHPDVVLVLEGVNGLTSIGAGTSAALVRAMVEHAQNGQARIFVGSMIPTLPNRQRSQDPAALIAYNTLLRGMSAFAGAIYVDLYDGMIADAEQLIGVDGLHPTEAGYRRIADLFFAAIQKELQEP